MVSTLPLPFSSWWQPISFCWNLSLVFFTQIRKQDVTSVITGLIILLGLVMAALPIFYTRWTISLMPYVMPYMSMRATYASLTGSVWIVLGVISLFGSKATTGGHG